VPLNTIWQANFLSNAIYSSVVTKQWLEYYNDTLWVSSGRTASNFLVSSENPLSALMTGSKYIYSNQPDKLNYRIAGFWQKQPFVWQNDKVFSLGYASDKIYSDLKSMDSLQSVKVVTSGIALDNNFDSNLKPTVAGLEKIDLTNMFKKISYNLNQFIVNEPKKFVYKLPVNLHNKLLFIKIDMMPEKDYLTHEISINGIKNNYTVNRLYGNKNIFRFVISPDNAGNLSDLSIQVAKSIARQGDKNIPFKIDKVEAFTMSMDNLLNSRQNFNQMNVTSYNTNGLTGDINIPAPKSVIAFSIPFDKGFSLKIDGQNTPIFSVNNGIIGANIEQGKHQVVLTYQAPGFVIGWVISIITLLFLIFFAIYRIARLKFFIRNK
jgi:uncharacterized membrane protein YfhO